jgi:hypothetical protein
MERSVKIDLPRAPTIFFNVGVRSQSAHAAWLVRVRLAGAACFARVQLAIPTNVELYPIDHASAIGFGTAIQCG